MIRFRRYAPEDGEAVRTLHEWAMRDAGTDPEDIPGTEDLQAIERAYLDSGGDFVVGIATEDGDDLPATAEGGLAAMGGFMPSEEGHEDERRVPGAAELHRMRVAPPLQGEGYGRELLAELESRIREAGFDRIVATTAATQRRAVAFYPAAGYREVDRSTFGEYELVHFEKEL
jgi:ribosomal protein S18 acetylase RimI-like enzyme